MSFSPSQKERYYRKDRYIDVNYLWPLLCTFAQALSNYVRDADNLIFYFCMKWPHTRKTVYETDLVEFTMSYRLLSVRFLTMCVGFVRMNDFYNTLKLLISERFAIVFNKNSACVKSFYVTFD